ncbi:hypothetical protein F5Y12DRAFT_799690 [Xylaria sp. FL1777]|nr:hypothetical protein F5Y12DRAFT_799690 [Xylaria sp. FL1777]
MSSSGYTDGRSLDSSDTSTNGDKPVINPHVINPQVINPQVINPQVINPQVINPPERIQSVAEWAAEQQRHEAMRLADRRNGAMTNIDDFKKMHHSMSEKLTSFVAGLARSVYNASKAGLKMDDFLDSRPDICLARRGEKHMVVLSIKCHKSNQVEYQKVCNLAETIVHDVYADPENKYLPAHLVFLLSKVDDPRTTCSMVGQIELGSDDKRAVDLVPDVDTCFKAWGKRHLPLQDFLKSHRILGQDEKSQVQE